MRVERVGRGRVSRTGLDGEVQGLPLPRATLVLFIAKNVYLESRRISKNISHTFTRTNVYVYTRMS